MTGGRDLAEHVLVEVALGVPVGHVDAVVLVGHVGKASKVPLWWDAGTLAFLQQFMARRVQEGALGSSVVICSTSVQSFGNRLDRMNLSR